MDRSLIKLSGVAALTALAVLAVSTASAGSTTTAASTGSAGWRGTVVSVSDTPVLSMKQEQVEEFLEPLGVYVPQARHGVDAYQIVYRTVDVRGRATTASSLAALPRTNDRRLRLAVWLHGTQSYRLDAPSVSECCDRAAVVLFASLGYAATAPDYLGLGAGPGTHPYFHAETAVSASVDALRAARHFAARYGRTVGGPVAVAGFSQGANNSFLLARALQRGADRDFSLGALAPISGAYHLFDVEWPAAIGGDVDPKASTYYLAYLTVAWNRIYHLYADESEVFRDPYAGHVATLFDGEHTIGQTNEALPAKPSELLRPEYTEMLLQPTGRLAAAAWINDDACLGWRPAVPVRMYAAHGDPEAVYANSERCERELRGAGADVTLTDVGDVDHITSLVLSVPQIATWFATLR